MKDVGLDGAIAQNMVLNDLFHQGWGDVAVPSTVRIHQQDGALLTDSEAVCFGAKDDAGAFWLRLV